MASYDKRELEIIDKLKQGRTREDIAKDYDHSSWKSLDMFMRTRDYVWNGEENIYELEVTSNMDNIREQLISNISIKAEHVMNRISEGEDPRQIAKSLRFNDGHREMAEYMEKEGLVWDSEEGNYVESNVKSGNTRGCLSNGKSSTDHSETSKISDFINNRNIDMDLGGLDKYLPIFEMLYENRDRLSEVLLENDKGNIPKYIVPGAAKTKSIYMNDKIARLMADFSTTNNISQREVVETSIILYLKQ